MSAYRDKPDVGPMKRDWTPWRPYLMRLSILILALAMSSAGLFAGVVVGGVSTDIRGLIGAISLSGPLGFGGAFIAGAYDSQARH